MQKTIMILAILLLVISFVPIIIASDTDFNSNTESSETSVSKIDEGETSNGIDWLWVSIITAGIAALFSITGSIVVIVIQFTSNSRLQKQNERLKRESVLIEKAENAAGFIAYVEKPFHNNDDEKLKNKHNFEVLGRYYKLAAYLDREILEEINKYIKSKIGMSNLESNQIIIEIIDKLHEIIVQDKKDESKLDLISLEQLIKLAESSLKH